VEKKIVFGVWERRGMMEVWKTVAENKRRKTGHSCLSPISTSEEILREKIKLKKIELTS